jgi:diguanylate cyclase (GGDEF)-like protein
LAVLCLDLDRFKEVNDLFGHAAGDSMLVNVARTVSSTLQESSVLARLGGDEFAILAECDHAVSAGRLAESILEEVRRDNADGAGPLAAMSIGIAVFPDDAADRDLLLSYADTALYRAKAEGRGTYRFFEQKMGAEVRERRLIEHDLRHAVARNEMRIVFQPQTDVRSGDVVGFEALLRWDHPERGSVSPAVFIPVAEESGSILQIGEWVVRETCREAASWPKPLSVAVNVSAVQIHSPSFVQTVHEILFLSGLKPDRLEIEITETALIRDPSRAQSTLRQLKALGVRIAMDDFGTGYSSLSNLRAYPFDKIKIDGSFIRAVDTNEQTAAIVRSVLGLGRGLGLPVLAEGVETDAELKFLAAENCTAAQGYLMGRPSAIESFRAYTHGDELVSAQRSAA